MHRSSWYQSVGGGLQLVSTSSQMVTVFFVRAGVDIGTVGGGTGLSVWLSRLRLLNFSSGLSQSLCMGVDKIDGGVVAIFTVSD